MEVAYSIFAKLLSFVLLSYKYLSLIFSLLLKILINGTHLVLLGIPTKLRLKSGNLD